MLSSCTYNLTTNTNTITFFWTVRSCPWGGDWNCRHVGPALLCWARDAPWCLCCLPCPGVQGQLFHHATGLFPHQALLTADCRGSCIAETERTLVSSVLSLHPAKLCCYSQHFAGPVWVACCSAVLDSPTNGTCSCTMVLPQLFGTLDKETMLPCTDRGSAHN